MLKLIPKVASASFLLALMLAFEANAESRLPPCPADNNTSWTNCHGTWTEPNGGTYVGEFKDGKPNGQGTFTLSDGRKYVGEFKDDKLNGQGTFTVPDGRKYVGEFKDDKLNGQGTLTWPDGRRYVGEFKDFNPNGQGTYTWPDGGKYVGGFKDGLPNGQGTDTFPNGVKYVGEFRDSKYNGQGTFTWPNGDKYVGEFKVGERTGQGTYTWPDGFEYVGEFKDGKRNGYGTLYSSNGTVKQFGVWKDDILVGSSAENSSNKATTPALGLPEKTNVYLFLILLAIAGIAAIFLMKNRTEPSIRVYSPTAATRVPATESVESDPENGPRPVDDAAMDAWRASLEPPESRPRQTEQVVQQPSPTSGKIMDFQTAIKTCFNKYAVFNGRASRSEYWFYFLGISIVSAATLKIDGALFVSSEKILRPIWSLIIMLPTLAVTVRRLHDTCRSGCGLFR